MQALTSAELSIFLLTIGIMLILASFLFKLGHVFNIPTLVAQLLAGIILGPTFLGMLFPELHGIIFPEQGNLPGVYDGLFDLSIVMLLFVSGLHLDFNLLTEKTKAILTTSLLAISFPFIAGFWFAWQYFDFLNGIEISAAPNIFPLTFGTLISLSSLPILMRILMMRNLVNTSVGITILGTAIVTDLLGWFGFSSILVYGNASVSNIQILYTLFYIMAFFAIVFTLSGNQKLMGKLLTQKVSKSGEPSYDLAMLFGICLLTAAFTNAIHIHASLGAFIAGIICRRIIGENNPITKQIELFIMNFFAPIFFISIGLKLNFIQNFNLEMVLAIFVLAFFFKISGAYLGARLGGVPGKPAGAIAFALNTRGTMEIIMGALALNLGLIGPQLFVALIIVALASGLVTDYAMARLLNLKASPEKISDLT